MDDKELVNECAIMSNLAYSREWRLNDAIDMNGYGSKLIANGWSFFADSFKCQIGGDEEYFAVAFINSKKKIVVIAHRGTIEHEKNYLADIEISQRLLPKITSPAGEFFCEVQKKLIETGDYSGFSIIHTGHSLGGFIAVLWAAAFKDRRSVSAISFDNPGTKTALIAFLRQGSAVREQEIEEFVSSVKNVRNYLTEPNIVNTTDEHVGLVFQIGNQNDTNPFKLTTSEIVRSTITAFARLWHTQKSHSMERIVEFFNMNLLEKAKPVSQWPLCEYELQYKAPEVAIICYMVGQHFSWSHLILNVNGVTCKVARQEITYKMTIATTLMASKSSIYQQKSMLNSGGSTKRDQSDGNALRRPI